jgi:arylsulfatase A-like enzyme
VASPRKFLELVANDEITESQLETVRGLYAGEVETVDEQLDRITAYLERTGLDEETLTVITSDHGENLGETDEMGRKRMGHEGSVSDAVLSVPLVIAHPALEASQVDDYVSLKQLHDLLVGDVAELLDSGGTELGALTPPTDPVWSHYPAVGGEYLFEKYPDAPTRALEQRVSIDTVVAYSDGWKVVATSDGERWAQQSGTEAEYDNVPAALQSQCEQQLASLTSDSGSEEELSDEDISQLEALGYM